MAMTRKELCIIALLLWAAAETCHAQESIPNDTEDTPDSLHTLDEVHVTSSSTTRRMSGAVNGVHIGRGELFKAACCNLGESFTTNPSVDVSYSDAATGAKQIRLLGLSGTYVQLLAENIPAYRGAAAPYALGYVPGLWMRSLSVSKGCASVKNGYESMTGQINIDFLKPEDETSMEADVFGDSKSRVEANMTGNIHIDDKWSTALLVHYENIVERHDDNDDGFYDRPKVEQAHADSRWTYVGDKYAFRAGVSVLAERRRGGQLPGEAATVEDVYKINMDTRRYEGYMKHAFILDYEHGTNIALMGALSLHETDALYGATDLYINQKNAYASLIFETDITQEHSISAGASINHDYYSTDITVADGTAAEGIEDNAPGETVPGLYAQYTLTLSDKLTAMAGFRADHSSIYGTFYTPRFHVRYAPSALLSVRLSAGKGYRTPRAIAENSYLLASGRTLTVDKLKQEEAWNYGASVALNIPVAGRTLRVNAEYYYTDFTEQAVTDYDSDPHAVHITNLDGRSYSHVVQIDADVPLTDGLTLAAAYRFNKVMCTYGGRRLSKPLTNRYKSLFSLSYKTPLELWEIDVTLQLNGGGRMPTPYITTDGTTSWDGTFHSYEQLSAQVTRYFRHWSVYVGGENLTGFKQKNPIVWSSDPWGTDFDATMVWGPTHGMTLYAGIRLTFGGI